MVNKNSVKVQDVAYQLLPLWQFRIREISNRDILKNRKTDLW